MAFLVLMVRSCCACRQQGPDPDQDPGGMWLQPPRLQKEPRQRTAGTQLETTSIATPAQDSNGAEYQRAVRPAKAEAVRHHRRSEERRAGKEGVSPCTIRWSPIH